MCSIPFLRYQTIQPPNFEKYFSFQPDSISFLCLVSGKKMFFFLPFSSFFGGLLFSLIQSHSCAWSLKEDIASSFLFRPFWCFPFQSDSNMFLWLVSGKKTSPPPSSFLVLVGACHSQVPGGDPSFFFRTVFSSFFQAKLR